MECLYEFHTRISRVVCFYLECDALLPGTNDVNWNIYTTERTMQNKGGK